MAVRNKSPYCRHAWLPVIRLALLVGMLGIVLPHSSIGETNRVVRVGAFQYYPGIFKDKDGSIKGFYVEMLEEIAHLEHWTIEYHYGTWSEGLQRIRSNEVDILTSVARTEERNTYLDYTSTPLLTVWGELYVREGATYNNIGDMDGKTIAVMKDDFNGGSFKKLAQELRINCNYVEVADFEAVFQAVADRKVDGGVVNSTYGTAKQRLFPVKSTGVIFHPFDIYFAVLKGSNTNLLSTLDRYLEQWQRDKQSIYHTALRRWVHGMVEVMPSWVWMALVASGVVFLMCAAFIVLLRIQVRKATEQLRQREARLQAIFEAANQVAFIIVGQARSESRILEISSGTERLFACKREEIAGSPLAALFSDRIRDNIRSIAATVETSKCGWDGEIMLARKTGEPFPAIVNAHPLCERPESESAVLLVAIDITGRVKAEAHLRESEERYRRLFETCQEGIWTLDETHRTVLINQTMADMLGYAIEEMTGRPIEDFIPPEELEEHAKQLRSRAGETVARYEKRFKRKDGALCHTLMSASAISSKEGRPAGWFLMCNNITDYRRLEEHLRQVQKMEAIGRLAGGIAHDFNNILAAMLLNMGLLKQASTLPREARDVVGELELEAKRAASLVRQLLLFSRRSIVQVRPIDLNEVIANMLKMLQRLVGETVALDFNPAKDPVWIRADAGMMEQVLMNLTVNARDAMPNGGQLRIQTLRISLNAPAPQTAPDIAPGDYVCLSVTDTGCGMDEGVQQRLFEPFYTTKEVGKGTGLGLATIYGIVKQHRGWIEVLSKLQEGSTFKVFLPALPGPTPALSDADSLPQVVRGGQEVLLLVEDDASVRKVAGMILRQHGYQVLEAGNGVEAMSLWLQWGGKIDLLLTDMVMPEGISGLDLAGRLSSESSRVKVIISSGYSLEAAKKIAPNAFFLSKPYEAENLLKIVRDCLDGRDCQPN